MYDINNDITLIWNYINGDLVDNKVRLEDDYKFMVDVLNVSRDKNMYYNCSDDLKYSFDLSYFIIDKFRDDEDFVLDVAANFFENSSDIEKRKDMLLLVADVLEKFKDKKENSSSKKRDSYLKTADDLVKKEKKRSSLFIESVNDKELKKILGLGFLPYYKFHPACTTKVFAKAFLEDIFCGDLGELGNIMHAQFCSLEDLKEYGITQFLIDYVMIYDQNLAMYLQEYEYLLNDAKKKVNVLIKNWDKYEEAALVSKRRRFKSLAEKRMKKYDTNYSYADYLKILKNCVVEVSSFFSDDLLSYDRELENAILSVNDYRCLLDLIEIAKGVFYKNYFCYLDDDEFEQDDIEYENVNGECEIIEFNKALAKRKNKNK